MLRGHKVTILRRSTIKKPFSSVKPGFPSFKTSKFSYSEPFSLIPFMAPINSVSAVFPTSQIILRKPSNANSIVRSRPDLRPPYPTHCSSRKRWSKEAISTPFRERITLIVLFKMSSLIAPSFSVSGLSQYQQYLRITDDVIIIYILVRRNGSLRHIFPQLITRTCLGTYGKLRRASQGAVLRTDIVGSGHQEGLFHTRVTILVFALDRGISLKSGISVLNWQSRTLTQIHICQLTGSVPRHPQYTGMRRYGGGYPSRTDCRRYPLLNYRPH